MGDRCVAEFCTRDRMIGESCLYHFYTDSVAAVASLGALAGMSAVAAIAESSVLVGGFAAAVTAVALYGANRGASKVKTYMDEQQHGEVDGDAGE